MAEKKAKKDKANQQVTIYSTPTCPTCRSAKRYFDRKGIEFEDIDVMADQEQAHKMIHLSGQTTVPVIVVGEKVMVGFSQVEFEKIMGGQKT